MKRRPFSFLRLDPDSPAMPFDDLFADGKPDAGSGILVSSVQSLENDKDPVEILLGNADSIIAHRKMPATRLLLDTNADLDRTFTAELDRIGNKVLKELGHLDAVTGNGGKLRPADLCSALFDGNGQVA